jgi:hypothetical protein
MVKPLFSSDKMPTEESSQSVSCAPVRVERPSATDEETMRESFGAWDFVAMIILTKSGRFYARVDFNHEFGSGFRQRFNVQCEVEVLWTEAGEQPIGRETLAAWDKELKELVREMPPLTSASSVEPWSATASREWGLAVGSPKLFPGETNKSNLCQSGEITSEVGDHIRACINSGIDPDEPDVFERDSR